MKRLISSIDDGREKDLLEGSFCVVVKITPSVILADKVFNIVEQTNYPSDRSPTSHVIVRLPVKLSKDNATLELSFLLLFGCAPRLKDLQLPLQLRDSSSLPGVYRRFRCACIGIFLLVAGLMLLALLRVVLQHTAFGL
jgi:hypothetical protein